MSLQTSAVIFQHMSSKAKCYISIFAGHLTVTGKKCPERKKSTKKRSKNIKIKREFNEWAEIKGDKSGKVKKTRKKSSPPQVTSASFSLTDSLKASPPPMFVCVWPDTYSWWDAYQMPVVSRLTRQKRVTPTEKSDFRRCPLIPQQPPPRPLLRPRARIKRSPPLRSSP